MVNRLCKITDSGGIRPYSADRLGLWDYALCMLIFTI